MKTLVYQQRVSFQINPQDLPLLSFSAPPLEVRLRCFGLTFIKGMIARDAFADHLSGWSLDRDLIQPDGLSLHQPGGSAVVLRGALTPEDPNVVLDVIPSIYETEARQCAVKHPVVLGTSADDPHIAIALLPDTGRLYRFTGVAYVYDSLDLWAMDISSPSDPITYQGMDVNGYPVVAANAVGTMFGRVDLDYNPLTHQTTQILNGRLLAPWGSAGLPNVFWRTGSLQDFEANYDRFAPWSEGAPLITVNSVVQDAVPAQIQASFPESAHIQATWPDGAVPALQSIARAGSDEGSVGQWMRSLRYLDEAPIRGMARMWPPMIDAQNYYPGIEFLTSDDESSAGIALVYSDPSQLCFLPFLITRGILNNAQIVALFSGFGWRAGVSYHFEVAADGDIWYANLYVQVEGEEGPRTYHRDVTSLMALPEGSRRFVTRWAAGAYVPVGS